MSRGDDFDLMVVMKFVRRNWLVIAALSLAGLGAAGLLIMRAPKEYEAVAGIEIARTPYSGLGAGGEPVEAVDGLSYRLTNLGAYPPDVRETCAGASVSARAPNLAGGIRVSLIKGKSTLAEIVVRGGSSDMTVRCANAVVTLVAEQQMDMLRGYLRVWSENEDRLNRQLEIYRNKIKTSPESDRQMLMFFALNISQWIETARQEVSMAAVNGTRLLAPVRVAELPIYPAKGAFLIRGLLAGFLLGVALAALKDRWAGQRNRPNVA